PFVVPREHDLAHEVRVRGLEAGVPFERLRKPHDATLATDATDLDRLLAEHQVTRVRSTRSAETAPSPLLRPTSTRRSASHIEPSSELSTGRSRRSSATGRASPRSG